ncbi:hypothetical protein WMF30_48725 [Sorangium sp. So ce134]
MFSLESHHIIDAIREVHNAIEIYSAALPDTMSPAAPLTTRFRFGPTPAREGGDPAASG